MNLQLQKKSKTLPKTLSKHINVLALTFLIIAENIKNNRINITKQELTMSTKMCSE